MAWIVATAPLTAGTRRVAATTLMARGTFRTISHMTHPDWPEHPSGKTAGTTAMARQRPDDRSVHVRAWAGPPLHVPASRCGP